MNPTVEGGILYLFRLQIGVCFHCIEAGASLTADLALVFNIYKVRTYSYNNYSTSYPFTIIIVLIILNSEDVVMRASLDNIRDATATAGYLILRIIPE